MAVPIGRAPSGPHLHGVQHGDLSIHGVQENARRDRVNRLEKLGAKFEEDVERLEAATDNLSKGYERISERSESLSKSVEKLDNTVGNLREAVAALRAGREKYLGEGASRVKGGDDG